VFAGLYYWFPKMFGRHMSETLGKIHFWGTVVPFNVIFLPLFILGAAGDHRRIVSYQLFAELATPALQTLRMVATVALIVMLLFQGVFLGNFFYSMWRGRAATSNPWRANTLEWAAPSPPPHGNFLVLPEVYRPPYEYSVPGRTEDYWPQHEPAKSSTES
jgi:cytochrome c oxidase subunit 1